jgi:hypothetical protein
MSKTVALLHPHETFQISPTLIIQKCDLFMNDPMLIASPYNVKSPVSLSDFRQFLSLVKGTTVKITNNNFKGLSQLCDEFGFRDLVGRLSEFRASDDFKEQATTEDLEARKRISALEERMQQRDDDVASLRCELLRQAEVHESAVEALLGRVGRLEAEVTAPTLTQLQPDLRKPKVTTPSGSVSAAAPTPTPPQKSQVLPPLAPVPASALPPTSGPPALRSPSGWTSVIVSGFPEIFAEFKEKSFTLLWRGSRDGFDPSDFHSRCDGHANTLTVILDTDGNIFGGFTPVEWESRVVDYRSDGAKADASLASFIFTLKNPHNIRARRFALKAERKDEAICCVSDWGPSFGSDMHVFDNCNNTESSTYLGNTYTNDTGLDGFY